MPQVEPACPVERRPQALAPSRADGHASTHLMPAAQVGSAWQAAICEGHAFSRQSITGDGGAKAGEEERSESIELC